eukprot:843828-Pelagomonas_calceolata.AAC.3
MLLANELLFCAFCRLAVDSVLPITSSSLPSSSFSCAFCRLTVNSVSPVTRMPLANKFLAPNPGLKAAILEEIGGQQQQGAGGMGGVGMGGMRHVRSLQGSEQGSRGCPVDSGMIPKNGEGRWPNCLHMKVTDAERERETENTACDCRVWNDNASACGCGAHLFGLLASMRLCLQAKAFEVGVACTSATRGQQHCAERPSCRCRAPSAQTHMHACMPSSSCRPVMQE